MEEIKSYLREAGYLETPTGRLFWHNVTPTLRGHLRQLALIAALVTVPVAFLFAVLSRLDSRDAALLFLFYLLVGALVIALADLLVGLIIRAGFRGKRGPFLIPVIGGLATLAASSWFLGDVIALRPLEVQLLVWPALLLIAWTAGGCLRLLFVGRLAWRGIKPPQYRGYPLLMLMSLSLLTTFAFFQTRARTSGQLPQPADQPPTLLLAFDQPAPGRETFVAGLPDWDRYTLVSEEDDISAFWISLGTGTAPDRHFASLVSFEAPLFAGRLSNADPTQRPLLALLRGTGLAEPTAGGDRTRKYFWEILDDLGTRTHAYAFWRTFPAASQNGGVLSERWTPEQTDPPYASGLRTASPSDPLPAIFPPDLQPTVARENQTWRLIRARLQSRDFDLLIAYFPLADLLEAVPEADRDAVRAALIDDRIRRVIDLLTDLPEDARVAFAIASGKTRADDDGITLDLIANWITEPLTDPLQLAPLMLNTYGVPRDRMMPRAPHSRSDALGVRDYGEPNPLRRGDPDADTRYYEELKSLGYIR